jgi:hypothetical protein
MLRNGSYTSFSIGKFFCSHQSGVVDVWCAHDPQIPRSKLGSDIYQFRMVLITLHHLLMLSIGNPTLSCPLEEPSVLLYPCFVEFASSLCHCSSQRKISWSNSHSCFKINQSNVISSLILSNVNDYEREGKFHSITLV